MKIYTGLLVLLVAATQISASAIARPRNPDQGSPHAARHASEISALTPQGNPFAAVYLVTSRETYQRTLQSLARQGVARRDGAGRDLVISQVQAHQLPQVSQRIHERELRCGGFFAFDTRAEADAFIRNDRTAQSMRASLVSYTIDNQATVDPWVPQVVESNIYDTINHLSSYQNRYYQTSTGQSSAQWIHDTWEGLATGRSDVTTELFACGNCSTQPSVILTIQGVEAPDEVVVLGGHLDSISNSGNGENMDAPGADDDASGIATLTEVIRIALADGWQPKRTVKFMGYAAEEVGLRGSNAIAQSFADDGVNVVGVLQLDMTNYKVGTVDDMQLITDYSNADLKTFLTELFDEYLAPLGLSRGTYTCGYGCSDHASWTSAGYPSAMMFEAGDSSGYFPYIHTTGDTLANMGESAEHSVKFAQFGLAFLGELAKTAGSGGNLPPNAEFTFVRTDLTVDFTDTSTDSDGTLVSWAWDFGDGATSTAQNPSHTYAAGAVYDVSLTVTDDDGGTDTMTVSVNLLGGALENGVPVTGIEAPQDVEILYTLEVPTGATNLAFTMSGGTGDADMYVRFGAPPTQSQWDCRPYESGNEEQCLIDPAQEGTYYVMLHAYDAFDGVSLVGSFEAPPPVGCGDGAVLANGVPVTNVECTAGSSQYFILAVPAGATNLKFTALGGTGNYSVYVKEGSDPTPSDYDCKQTRYKAKPCGMKAPAAGTYHVLVYGETDYAGVTVTGSYTVPLRGGSTGSTVHADTRQVAIGDNATVQRSIQVTGKGRATGEALVSVNIATAYRGDLKVELVSPSGRVYALHNRSGGSANNLVASYRVNLLGEPLNGQWKLRVSDNAAGDNGLIKGWSIRF